MSVCPFCKAPVAMPQAACPGCGKLAADHPSIAAMSGRTLGSAFDDDDDDGAPPDLEIESSGGALGPHAGMPFESGKGVTLDDDLFGDDEAAGPLELDAPAKRHAPAEAHPPPQATPAATTAGPARAPEAAEDQAARRIANYPPPPAKVWQAPSYAVRVLWRRFELRQDLASLRRRRSRDVALYERALTMHDPRAYATGLVIAGALLLLATILFFMPVIKRFAFAPD